MTVKEIKNLPNEFDFVSRINPYGILYHAVKKKHSYEVAWEGTYGKYSYSYSKEEFRRKLLNNEFVPK
jgi:hypothetical protein